MWPPLHYNIRSIAENGGTEIAARGDAVAQMPIGSESSLEVKAPIQLRASGQPDHSLRMVHVLQSGKYLTFPLCITRVSASRYTKFIFKLCVTNWLLGVRRCSKISKVWSSVRQRARCSLLQWELLGSLLWSASLPDGCGFAAAPPPAPASPPAAPAPATKSSLLASPHCWQSCTLSSDATCHLINMIVTIAIDNDLKIRREGPSLSSLRGCSPEGNVDEVGWEGAVPRLGCC